MVCGSKVVVVYGVLESVIFLVKDIVVMLVVVGFNLMLVCCW